MEKREQNELRMNLPNVHFARAVRDGGIHAAAALNHALAQALESLPADHGLSKDQVNEVKRIFGDVMAEIYVSFIAPAFRTFPELEPSQATWSAAVVEQAKELGVKAAATLEGASIKPLFSYPNDSGPKNG